MSLLRPPGALSQRFGMPVSAALKYEPAGFYQGSTRFFWSQFPGSAFAYHYHPGEDWFGPLNTHLPAVEAGVVTQAGWGSGASGYHVVVRIKAGTEYGYGHLNGRPPVVIGQHVVKGQTIGYMGRSGTATGIHTHFYLQIWEKLNGVYRTMIYNPALFYAGGSLANDPRIQPGYTPLPIPKLGTRAELNGNGINVRESAGRVGSYTFDAVYAVSVGGAVRRRSDGADLGHWVRGDSDTATTAFSLFKRGAYHGIQPYPDQWAAVWCGNAYRAVARPLVTIS